eukprot:TRINITY_DN54687_c0_g1_i1.p1 TRINITY_DN54687_c0_g1~~TRINITY_DN54687_c0_g1_i1.p1  ORF type:complete len:226 (+),score=42.95 TRINITY_DN54687_c0_g1_i1:124-801(+)
MIRRPPRSTLSSSSAASDVYKRQSPHWPKTFQANWTSHWKATEGLYATDTRPQGAQAELIVLEDGTRDHLCSARHNNTMCVQLTVSGFRYHYFPGLPEPDCCRCCSYAPSSKYECAGPLSPSWLDNVTGNLEYLGVHNVSGRECAKWNSAGLGGDPNFYYQDLKDGEPCEVDGYNYLRTPAERSDDQYIFEKATYTNQVPPELFAVPPLCEKAAYCGPPVCSSGP